MDHSTKLLKENAVIEEEDSSWRVRAQKLVLNTDNYYECISGGRPYFDEVSSFCETGR